MCYGLVTKDNYCGGDYLDTTMTAVNWLHNLRPEDALRKKVNMVIYFFSKLDRLPTVDAANWLIGAKRTVPFTLKKFWEEDKNSYESDYGHKNGRFSEGLMVKVKEVTSEQTTVSQEEFKRLTGLTSKMPLLEEEFLHSLGTKTVPITVAIKTVHELQLSLSDETKKRNELEKEKREREKKKAVSGWEEVSFSEFGLSPEKKGQTTPKSAKKETAGKRKKRGQSEQKKGIVLVEA